MNDQQLYDAFKRALNTGGVTSRDFSIDLDQVTFNFTVSAGTLLATVCNVECKNDAAVKRKWSEDVKIEAVELMKQGVKISEIVTKLGVPDSTLRGWLPKSQKRAREEGENEASAESTPTKKKNNTNEVNLDSSAELDSFYCRDNTKSRSPAVSSKDSELAADAASASPDRNTVKAPSPLEEEKL